MNHVVTALLRFWIGAGSWLPIGLSAAWVLWNLARIFLLELQAPERIFHERKDPVIRFLLQRRRSKASLPLGGILLAGSVWTHHAAQSVEFINWVTLDQGLFLGIHAAALGVLVAIAGFLWDPAPGFLRTGQGRADAEFLDVSQDFGSRGGAGGVAYELLAYRNPAKRARRLMYPRRYKGHLTLVSITWEASIRHILVFGTQGSGKTSACFGHAMHSAACPWIYQDSKAELPYLSQFPGALVWGLDVRGHETRSGVWNPISEIRTVEDFELITDYVFPENPQDANPWVRGMARTLFRAILESRPWSSLQEIARSLRATRLEPFLKDLPPVWQDLMKEPKSQVPILQDLIVTLSRWETARIRAITEGENTVSLDAYIRSGGYILNNEESNALKAPVHLFWAMLLGRLRNRPEGASPLLLLLDEFGDCGRIPNIQNALALLRSKGVSVTAGIQSMGLLKDVYRNDWEAVLDGFGTQIWLARNLQDEPRLKLSQRLGKFTRKVPPSGKNANPTEKEVDLLPVDAWRAWSAAGAALSRQHGFTYWLPLSLQIPKTPLGPVMAPSDPWTEREAASSRHCPERLPGGITPAWPKSLAWRTLRGSSSRRSRICLGRQGVSWPLTSRPEWRRPASPSREIFSRKRSGAYSAKWGNGRGRLLPYIQCS